MSVEIAKTVLENFKKEKLVNEEKIRQAHHNMEQLNVISAQLVGAIHASESILKLMEASIQTMDGTVVENVPAV